MRSRTSETFPSDDCGELKIIACGIAPEFLYSQSRVTGDCIRPVKKPSRLMHKKLQWVDGALPMTIEIPPDLQPFVREQLELGCFPNEQQLVTEALQLLKAERDESVEGIRKGLADAAAGRVQPLAEAFADLRREFKLPDPT